jgi:predicted DsbA family dithiol-disulfide isomerase
MIKPELKVTVYSDYICPFCYIGSRRLLRLNDDYDLKINWCGLEIHPDTPAEGMPVAKLGYQPEQWAQMMATLRKLAEEENIELGEHSFTTNSHKALLLSEATKQAGREIFYALHERLFHAYFTEGKNIGDEQVLAALARECGLRDELIQSAWNDPALNQRLQQNMTAAQQAGIRATPTYLFGGRTVVGAVPLEELRQAAMTTIAC